MDFYKRQKRAFGLPKKKKETHDTLMTNRYRMKCDRSFGMKTVPKFSRDVQ